MNRALDFEMEEHLFNPMSMMGKSLGFPLQYSACSTVQVDLIMLSSEDNSST